MFKTSLFVIAIASLTVACGGDDSNHPDARRADAEVDSPPPPPGCDYAELKDMTNDSISESATGAPESTFLDFATPKVICGQIDQTHYDAAHMDLDGDSYTISLGADSEVRLDIVGTGLEVLDDVEVIILDSQGGVLGDGVYLGNHGVTEVLLDAGTYQIAVYSGNATAPASTAPIPYKIKIAPYDLLTACPVVAVANHTEGATDNDVFAVKFGMSGFRQLTTKNTDAVEPSTLTLAGGTNVAIGGSIANTGAVDADDYLDRDAFEFTTGANVTELALRVDWTNTMADLDFYMTPKIQTPPTGNVPYIIDGAYDTGVGAAGQGGPEINMTAVEPNTPYWIWVGGYIGSLALPSTYTISLCPTAFTP